MLFKASITSETIKNLDKLTEQLYIFLEEYVPTRTRYESYSNQQDCMQDTILFMLDRFKKLDTLPNEFNYEKFFYNRARSYISYWLKRLSRQRANESAYLEMTHYLKEMLPKDSIDKYLINISLLNNIIKEYCLDSTSAEVITSMVTNNLIELGYIGIPLFIPNHEHIEILQAVASAVLDEYLEIDNTPEGDT